MLEVDVSFEEGWKKSQGTWVSLSPRLWKIGRCLELM